jgi:hypothetical protein
VAVAGQAIEKLPRKVLSPVDGARWLWKIATTTDGAILARPAHQPEAVHEFSGQLFDAYQVDGGQTHLAGCHLTDVPFLRVTRLCENAPDQVAHRFYTAEGQLVSEHQLTALSLADVQTRESTASRIGQPQIERLLQLEQVGVDDPQFVAVTVIVAKRAEGALQFDIGEQCARVRFDDWTSTLTAPPFRCAATGLETYHLTAIDDGRIVAAEAVDSCEESGARVLGCERVTCAITGKRVDPRLVATCPGTGEKVLATELQACHACGQKVCRTVLAGGVCPACRKLPSARRSDSVVAELLGRYPQLDGYRKFQAGESGGLVRVMAVGVWRRVLLVRPTGNESTPTRIAVREGFAGPWRELSTAEAASLLGAPPA